MLRHKHQRLVEAVLPRGNETVLHSANLSLLIFYANARPAKVVKLATYLARRITATRGQERQHYLTILDAVAEGCATHMALFANSLLAVVESILSDVARVVADVQIATRIFTRFSAAPTVGRVSLLEAQHVEARERLSKLFCENATAADSDENRRAIVSAACLRALSTLLDSVDLHASRNRGLVNCALPVLFVHLTDASTDLSSASGLALSVLESFAARVDVSTSDWLFSTLMKWLGRPQQWTAGVIPAYSLPVIQGALVPACRIQLLTLIQDSIRGFLASDDERVPNAMTTLASLVRSAATPLGILRAQLVDLCVPLVLQASAGPVPTAARTLLDAAVDDRDVVPTKLTIITNLLERLNPGTAGDADAAERQNVALLELSLRVAQADDGEAVAVTPSGGEAGRTAAPVSVSALSLVLPTGLIRALLVAMGDASSRVSGLALELLVDLVRALLTANSSIASASSEELRLCAVALFREQHERSLRGNVTSIIMSDAYGPVSSTLVVRLTRMLLSAAVATGNVEFELSLWLSAFREATRASLADGGAISLRYRTIYATARAYLEVVADVLHCPALAAIVARLDQAAPPSQLLPLSFEIKLAASLSKLRSSGTFKRMEKKVKKEGAQSESPATPSAPIAAPEIPWTQVVDAIATLTNIRKEAVKLDDSGAEPAVKERKASRALSMDASENHQDATEPSSPVSPGTPRAVFSAVTLQRAAAENENSAKIAPQARRASITYSRKDDILAFVSPRDVHTPDADDY